jgi:DNA-binding GntR family transcriptional regulator
MQPIARSSATIGKMDFKSQDRMPGHKLPLTQQFLSDMLGTRRASVTVAAGILQKAGLISYRRGSVTILDRPGLESATCDCYAILERRLKQWDEETKTQSRRNFIV